MYQTGHRNAISQLETSNSGNAVETVLRLLLLVVVFVAGGIAYRAAEDKGLIEPAASVAGVNSGNLNPQAGASEKVAAKLFIPDNEQPTVATISDVDKLILANPNFYYHAKNGDKLLIYSDRAVIYREEQDIIINVLPVKRGDTATPTPTSNVTQTVQTSPVAQ